ncbi:AAA family ATPase [Qipengyuania vesicularis]|uniref:AAA family ATPase n=1 Tax=Qipengyuania vesicularis TaxID=2867232 RepID=UPI001C8753B1|nr:ATP-binding protein [Qipengyuania vesicularis]MBX7528174.1 ATP-binding protein [Qipengyuania vesicularis]
MTQSTPTLHLLCGKIASGKSSLAAALTSEPQTVLISEDQLLSDLYPGEIDTLEAFRDASARLRKAIAPHIVQLLANGLSVVLDFQANTPGSRKWMKDLVEASGAAHKLHWLRASDETCKRRLGARNAAGTHEYQVSEQEFDLFTSYFVEPEADEGFVVEIHEQD